MMRLRRQYIPVYANNRVTRGMGNVSMLRLRRAPSYMRLKKMTQMRLKRMTQMRLKKSGVPPFEDSYENDLENVVGNWQLQNIFTLIIQKINNPYNFLG